MWQHHMVNCYSNGSLISPMAARLAYTILHQRRRCTIPQNPLEWIGCWVRNFWSTLAILARNGRSLCTSMRLLPATSWSRIIDGSCGVSTTRSCSLTITSLRSSLGSFWPRCGLSWFSSSRVVFQNSSEEHCGLSIPGLAIFRTAFSCILRRSFLGGLPCCLETKLPSKLHLNARERLERSYVFGVRPHCKSDTHPTILRSHGCFTHARTLQSSDSTAMSRCGKLLICWQRGPGQKQKNGCQLDTFSLFLFRFP